MTRRRRRLLISLALLALLGVLALPGVHWRLIGWWHGEVFYDGRPASCWSSRIQKYGYGLPDISKHGGRYYVRPYDPLARVKQAFGLANAYDPFVDREVPFFDPDPDAVPVLIVLLADPEPTVRGYAAVALRRFGEEGMGEAAKPAIPALRRLLTDISAIPGEYNYRQATVADTAARALQRIDPDALKEAADPDDLPWATDNAAAVPVLVQLLDDPSDNVRGWSAWALGRAGPVAREAIPALCRLRTDRGLFLTIKCSVGMATAQALCKIDPDAFKDADRP
jgi:HEAT repeat protein